MDTHSPGYRLVRPPVPALGPVLDEAQRAVASHTGGPLLVLAGPGTGKTTTLVAAVADRVARRGTDPERVLVLTFSRKAAMELRERITARLGRTTRQPLALTFHSYAWALLRREFTRAGDQPPGLLPGPEQLAEVRRMLRGEAEDGGVAWPERLRAALPTAGFAAELRDFLLRAAERGLDGTALARLGRSSGRDDWVAAGGFLRRYAARFDLAPVPAYDYAEVIRIAAAVAARDSVQAREAKAYDLICVDEYQDTDPAQEELLRAVAGGGQDLIAVGDPDQSIYAFRGADAGAMARFPQLFATPDGRPADVIALRECRRLGPRLLAASRRVASRLPAAPAAGHRDLRAAAGAVAGELRVMIAGSESQEAALVADLLRRAHLRDGVPWASMAVLVRSMTRQAAPLRRALLAAGVPVAVAGDELPLAAEPGTRPLLLLLRCALRPASLDAAAAAELLTGPLGGTDALALRRLRRELRARGTATDPGEVTDPLVAALLDPRELILADGPGAAAATQVARLLALARDTARESSAHDVLWAVWRAAGLAPRWQAASAAGGTRGAAADRDLDAVCALFDAAAQFTERLPPGSPWLFLESLRGQEIPGDSLARRAPRGDAVPLMTAHRAKGLEWDVVVVAGVREGVWPDLRTRSSLLGMDAMVEAATGVTAPGDGEAAAAASLAAKLMAEERRLFYVAVTRARRRLVVTASGSEESEDRPSRFLAELAGADIEVEQVPDTGRRWLSLPSLTAALRRAAADASRPPPLRQAAAAQLARLAAAGVPGAHPDTWYSLTRWSSTGPLAVIPAQRADPVAGAGQPASEAGQPASEAGPRASGAGQREWGASPPAASDAPAAPPALRVSPSAVESFTRCGLRWLLEVAVGARDTDVARHFGIVIHAAAALAATGASETEIQARVDEIWGRLDFGSAWYRDRQREQARQMVARFLKWQRENGRQLVATEADFRAPLGAVEIRGRVDRLESDPAGRAVVVDLKTGSSHPADADLGRHPQLGVYQLAVLQGAFGRHGLTQPGGAELVHVGKASRASGARVQPQAALAEDPDPGWVASLVREVAAGMAGPWFEARANPGCRSCPVMSCCPGRPEGARVGDDR